MCCCRAACRDLVPHCAVLCCALLYRTVLYCIVLYCIVPYGVVLNCIVLYHPVLLCDVYCSVNGAASHWAIQVAWAMSATQVTLVAQPTQETNTTPSQRQHSVVASLPGARETDMFDPVVINGVFEDVKKFSTQRWKDVQAMQVALGTSGEGKGGQIEPEVCQGDAPQSRIRIKTGATLSILWRSSGAFCLWHVPVLLPRLPSAAPHYTSASSGEPIDRPTDRHVITAPPGPPISSPPHSAPAVLPPRSASIPRPFPPPTRPSPPARKRWDLAHNGIGAALESEQGVASMVFPPPPSVAAASTRVRRGDGRRARRRRARRRGDARGGARRGGARREDTWGTRRGEAMGRARRHARREE